MLLSQIGTKAFVPHQCQSVTVIALQPSVHSVILWVLCPCQDHRVVVVMIITITGPQDLKPWGFSSSLAWSTDVCSFTFITTVLTGRPWLGTWLLLCRSISTPTTFNTTITNTIMMTFLMGEWRYTRRKYSFTIFLPYNIAAIVSGFIS